jgi:hypothetical protein
LITSKKASESYFKKDPFLGYLRDRKSEKETIAFSVGGWATLRGGFEFSGGRSFAGFEGSEGLVYSLLDHLDSFSTFRNSLGLDRMDERKGRKICGKVL